jgi:hypothetical protein
MTFHSFSGSIPGTHREIWVDTAYTHSRENGFLRAQWFGIEAFVGRVYEAHCLLLLPEGGAAYRALPLHALAHTECCEKDWTEQEAQLWDCYSWHFATPSYPYLAGLRCKTRIRDTDHFGHYWFTIKPVLDDFSAIPEQAKEFFLIALDNGRFTLQPTNRVLLEERSSTELLTDAWPTGLKRKTEIYSAE